MKTVELIFQTISWGQIVLRLYNKSHNYIHHQIFLLSRADIPVALTCSLPTQLVWSCVLPSTPIAPSVWLGCRVSATTRADDRALNQFWFAGYLVFINYVF